jgi:hypothetical protein
MKPFSEFQMYVLCTLVYILGRSAGQPSPLLRAGLWYLSALFLTLVCVIPIGMGCISGGVTEANQGPLLWKVLCYPSSLFLTILTVVCVIP